MARWIKSWGPIYVLLSSLVLRTYSSRTISSIVLTGHLVIYSGDIGGEVTRHANIYYQLSIRRIRSSQLRGYLTTRTFVLIFRGTLNSPSERPTYHLSYICKGCLCLLSDNIQCALAWMSTYSRTMTLSRDQVITENTGAHLDGDSLSHALSQGTPNSTEGDASRETYMIVHEVSTFPCVPGVVLIAQITRLFAPGVGSM